MQVQGTDGEVGTAVTVGTVLAVGFIGVARLLASNTRAWHRQNFEERFITPVTASANVLHCTFFLLNSIP